MRVDVQRISELVDNGKNLNNYIEDFLNNKCSPEDPPYLSDVIPIAAFNKGGIYLLEALAKRYEEDRDMPQEMKFTWRIEVMRDEWGNPPRPGDIINMVRNKPPEHGPGKPCSPDELTLDKINGVYDKKWKKITPYKVDEKGCITCEFQDAVSFLRRFGIHGKSGHNMSIHVYDVSADPAKRPDGTMGLVYYWRYREIDKEDYEKLPKIKDSSKPKEGFNLDRTIE